MKRHTLIMKTIFSKLPCLVESGSREASGCLRSIVTQIERRAVIAHYALVRASGTGPQASGERVPPPRQLAYAMLTSTGLS